MTIQEIKELALHAAKRTAPTNFTVENVDAALLDALKDMTGSINNFMRNRYDIYEIIIQTADKIVPDKVIDAMGQFAEIRQVGQGETVIFKRGPIGRNRAKKFLTQVGLSGVYETFRLDKETFQIATKAIGGAVTMDFERFLDGAENLADLMDVMTEAQVDGIYHEVQKALMQAVNNTKMPARNKVTGNYNADSLQKLIRTVRAYGGNAAIFAPPEFIIAMGPDAIVPAMNVSGTGLAQGIYSPDDIEAIHKTGFIKLFRGTPIVELRQSFFDEKNEQIMINPQFAYVLPTGNEKVVKIVMEGDTQMYDKTNRDQSIEINTYKKIGIGILAYNNWGIYQNTSIPVDDWYNDGGFSLGVSFDMKDLKA